MNHFYNKQLKIWLTATLIMLTNVSISAPLNLSDMPLFLKDDMPSNILLTLDNSSSMKRAWIFEAGVTCPEIHPCFVSPVNKQYYDPSISYLPPLKVDGTPMGDANFSNAWVSGFNHSIPGTVNLELEYIPTKELFIQSPISATTHDNISVTRNNSHAYYMKFDSSLPGCNGIITTYDDTNTHCFPIITDVSLANTGPNGTDERQNFANWYSYYRTRMLSVQAAISTTFADLDPDVRVAWKDLHFTDDYTLANNNYVNAFTGEHKTGFYSWLHNIALNSGTPLISALDKAGEYMSSTNSINPFATNPGATNHDAANDISCRSSFHAMFSDGAWYEPALPEEDKDNSSHTLPDGINYSPINPYSSSARNLADRAFYYWATDLRPDLENNVKTFMPDTSGSAVDQYWNSHNDPANWQHMVNYTITLGVGGNLVNPDDLADLVSGSKEWGTSYSEADKIDDNWHAAINSRGDYFAADKPSDLITAFSQILERVAGGTQTAAAVTTDSTQAADTRFLYQASFTGGIWTGTFQAFNFDNLTKGDMVFDAGCILTDGSCPDSNGTFLDVDQDDRIIITYDPEIPTYEGIPFRFNSLNDNQQDQLGSDTSVASLTLDYIRGDKSQEQSNGGSFRDRESLLGDIINSSPMLVLKPGRIFTNASSWRDELNSAVTIPENATDAQSFASFLQIANSTRHGMVYVGANDGMLHAFHAETGKEVFAYIPNTVFKNLPELANPYYNHKYFVDGSPISGEAFFNKKWHTMLVGQLRSGGQAVYAMDITEEPDMTDTETTIAEKLLWEFSHRDLGYGFGEPVISRLHNGKWAAIFGNGYNNTEDDGDSSSTGTASIFIIDIETGELIRQIDTAAGSPETPNGIAGVTTSDLDGDFIDDFIYAGDLNGNLWKFDIQNANPENWGSSYTTTDSTPFPLFKATTGTGDNLAITGKPGVIKHPIEGLLITFGTGKYLESSDNINTSVVNSFYGIWDRNINVSSPAIPNPITRSQLNSRTLLDGYAGENNNIAARELQGTAMDFSDTSVSGWFFDLPEGELQFTPIAQFDADLTLFTTFKPDMNVCIPTAGESWLYVIDTFAGKSPGYIPIDVDGDGDYDTNDNIGTGGSIASAVKLDGGGILAPLRLVAGAETSDTDGTIYDTATILSTSLNGSIGRTNIRKMGQQQSGVLEGRVKWRQIK